MPDISLGGGTGLKLLFVAARGTDPGNPVWPVNTAHFTPPETRSLRKGPDRGDKCP